MFKWLFSLLNLNSDFSLPCYDRVEETLHIQRVGTKEFDLTILNGDGTVTTQRLVAASEGRTHLVQ